MDTKQCCSKNEKGKQFTGQLKEEEMLVLRLKLCFPLWFWSRGWGESVAPTSQLEQGLERGLGQSSLSAEPTEILLVCGWGRAWRG